MHIAAHRSAAPGTATLCPWHLLTHNGVVTDRRGTLLAGYYASPPDAASSTESEREHTAHAVNAALLNFGTGTAMWSDVAVVPSHTYPDPALSHFPDPISRAVDEERRRQFMAEGAHFENERALIFAYEPPGAATGRLAHMMYRHGEAARHNPQGAAAEAFALMLRRFEDQAGPLLRLRRMQSYTVADPVTGRAKARDELVNYLGYCLTGRAGELDIPAAHMPLSGIIGTTDFWPGQIPVVGDEHVCCVAIDGFPAESYPGILDALTVLAMPYRFTQRFIPYSEVEAQALIDKKRKFWRQRMTPFFATIMGIGGGALNQDAVAMHDACEVSMALSTGGAVRHGWYCATVVLRHRDPRALLAMAREAERAIFRCGFNSRIETENAPDAFLATLPGNLANNVRRPMVHTYNVADLGPNSGIWTGSPEHPNPLYPPGSPALMHARTEGGIPFRFTPCAGDNGNFAFFGPPGTGKTTLLNATCLQFLRYQRARVRSIDFKRGMKASCLATGGAYYELGTEGSPAFCPFEHLATGADRARAEDWIEVVFTLQHGRPPSPDQRSVIHDMIEHLRTEPVRSITNALMLCHDTEISAALAYYSLDGGPGGALFDGASNDFADTHWDAYDITEIQGAGDPLLLPALMCLEQRFDRIEDGWPILETIDESWAAVSHPLWRPRLRRRWKTKRSKCVSIGIATQNLADMPAELVAIILENVPTIVYGANHAAEQGGSGDDKGPADFYRAFGMNERQRNLIRRLRRAREYYVTSPEGCRAVDFGFGPLTLSLAGATGEAAVNRITELRALHGEDWLRAWTTEQGIT